LFAFTQTSLDIIIKYDKTFFPLYAEKNDLRCLVQHSIGSSCSVETSLTYTYPFYRLIRD
jgi:hypothetical protein